MGPHSERESLDAATTGAVDLDFDLDGDTQIDVFVLSRDTELPTLVDVEPPPISTRPLRAPNYRN